MTEKLLLFAQSRDNRSPDHFEYAGRRVEASEIRLRAELARRVSELSLRGRSLYRDGQVAILRKRRKFLLEVTLEDRDELNRPLGILCAGTLDRRADRHLWSTQIAREVGRFAHSIDYGVDPELLSRVADALNKASRRGCTLTAAAVLTL